LSLIIIDQLTEICYVCNCCANHSIWSFEFHKI